MLLQMNKKKRKEKKVATTLKLRSKLLILITLFFSIILLVAVTRTETYDSSNVIYKILRSLKQIYRSSTCDNLINKLKNLTALTATREKTFKSTNTYEINCTL